MRAALLLGILVGCGEVQGQRPGDAPAPPDAPADAPSAPNAAFHYVADSQRVPTSNTEARSLGLDLNGDAVVDNQFGIVFGVLASQGFDLTGPSKTAIDRGQILMLPEIATASFTEDATATFSLFRGINPSPPACANANDLACRKHLAGTAAFGTDPTVPVEMPLPGAFSGGLFTAGPGHLNVQFMLGEGSPIAVTLRGARVQLKMATDTRLVDGIIGGAISKSDLDNTILPRFGSNVTAIVDRDCVPVLPPNCGCATGSSGQTLLDLFDTNPRDCKVTQAEIQGNSLIQSLFTPDVTIEGAPALSFGFGFSAVKGTFAAP